MDNQEEDDPVTTIIKEMGRKPNALLSSCVAEVSALRTSVVHSQRIITLAPLAHTRWFLEHIDEFPNSFKSYVFNAKELPSFMGFAQMTQNTGFLICYINEHPEVLASAILMSKVKSTEFVYLVRCAVPAVFGFFASQEHLSIAIKFYQNIVEKCSDQKIAILILQPLMHSAATFRFIESTFTKFTNALAVDGNANLSEENQIFCNNYSNFLVECISNSLPLLPQQILDLLCKLKDLKWEPTNFGELFFQKFLWKYANEWISHSPAKNHIRLLNKVIDLTSTNDELISKIYKILFTCKSSYELPCTYRPFGHMYLDFYISVHDIHVIAKLLHTCKLMPETVTLNELKRIPDIYEYNWYSCQVYPHVPTKPIDFHDEPIFHGKTNEVKLLEKLLCNRLYCAELEKWNNLINSCVSVVVDPFISEAVSIPISSKFRKTFRSMEKSFNLPKLNRKIFLSLIETKMKTWIDQNSSAILDHLDKQFANLLKSIHKREGLVEFTELTASMHESLRPTLLDTIKRLSSLENASLHDQFKILIEAMMEFRLIQEIEHFHSDGIYPVIFQQCNGRNFLSTFIKLNSFAMRNPLFAEICTDEEKVLWLKIESMILFCLKPDPVFLKAYITLQQQFIEIAAKNTQD